MGVFDSPRSSKADELFPSQLEGYDDLLNRIRGTSSNLLKVGGLNDLYNQFGVQPLDLPKYTQDVEAAYAPAKSNLASSLARSRSDIARRSGRSASDPFGATEGAFAAAETGLEGQESQQILGGYDKVRQQQMENAKLLESIYGGQDIFRAGKQQRIGSALGGRGNAIQEYLNSLSTSSPFEDIVSGGEDAALLAGGLGWKPFGK